MKALLIAIFLFLHAPLIFSSNRGLITSENVKYLNQQRRDAALSLRIANMHELTWHEGLVEKAKAMPKNCNEWRAGADYRFVPLADIDDKIAIGHRRLVDAVTGKEHAEISDLNVDNIKEAVRAHGQKLPTILNAEYYYPLQTKIGCAEIKCELALTGTWGKLLSTDPTAPPSEKTPLIGVCLLGPIGAFKTEDIKGGLPGSACPNKKNTRGLCSVLPKRENQNGGAATGAVKPETTTSSSSRLFIAFNILSYLLLVCIL
ncbi:unnamed protein product [Caenorhabditis sp. 36 PRJEB53466]|nr:unnamed protein product [Caenorhabditis sp. 36 PRJEB53466]